jgi:hypothetical protein
VPFGWIATWERRWERESGNEFESPFFSQLRFQDIFKLVFNAYSTNFFLMILFGFIGARTFAEDIESNVIENYYTRMPRIGYIGAKSFAVFISNLIVMLIPVLMIWTWLGSAFEEDIMAQSNFELITYTVLYIILLSAFYTGLALGISASTENRNYALTIFVVGFVVAGPFVTNILASVTENDGWLLLNVQEMLSPIYWDLVEPPVYEELILPPVIASNYEKMIELSPDDAWFLMTIVLGLCLLQIYRKVIRRG